jgi:hypothetical protein
MRSEIRVCFRERAFARSCDENSGHTKWKCGSLDDEQAALNVLDFDGLIRRDPPAFMALPRFHLPRDFVEDLTRT